MAVMAHVEPSVIHFYAGCWTSYKLTQPFGSLARVCFWCIRFNISSTVLGRMSLKWRIFVLNGM